MRVTKGKITPLRAIRLYCLECSNFQPGEVRNCWIPACPLYEYRLGTNPKRKGIGSAGYIKKPLVSREILEQNR